MKVFFREARSGGGARRAQAKPERRDLFFCVGPCPMERPETDTKKGGPAVAEKDERKCPCLSPVFVARPPRMSPRGGTPGARGPRRTQAGGASAGPLVSTLDGGGGVRLLLDLSISRNSDAGIFSKKILHAGFATATGDKKRSAEALQRVVCMPHMLIY